LALFLPLIGKTILENSRLGLAGAIPAGTDHDTFFPMPDFTKLSKRISYILRHAPWEYELELDDEGWVALSQLLGALNSGGMGDWGQA